jgi:hypothetical protein
MLLIELIPGLLQRRNIEEANRISASIKKPHRMTPESMATAQDRLDVERVALAPDKTLRMYIKGAKEPIRMYPDMNSVWFTAYYKRFIPLILHQLEGMGWIKRIITLLAIKYNYEIAIKWLEHIFSTYQGTPKEEHYSQPVKEIRRVLRGEMDETLVDAITLVLEYDSGYRYRFQDIIAELNISHLYNEYITAELQRLLDILTYREGLGKIDPASKWQKLKRLLPIIFFLYPKLKKKIVKILEKINIDEVKFNYQDEYWINQNPCHLYCGLSIEERQKKNIARYGSIK